ncbi:MAG TPA: 50S ribosomal protein L29 [Candidatus Saccharimonadales bacterium]|nr:50S ribosomal protein L29 [Candidatus Saccharimonadales bacterium]
MAEKKTTKTASEVKTVEQLKTDLAAKQKDLLDAKRSHAAGELVNPRVLTSTRKEIARLHTAIRAAELEQKESN